MMSEALKGLLRIPSETGCGEEYDEKYGVMPYGRHVFEALKYMLDLCESLGFRTKNCENRIGWAEIGEGEELIGILAHLDVVPAGNDWDYPPYDLTIANGQMYGRGVVDDKGPAFCAVMAMKELLDSGLPLKKRVRIIFGCQEETGDWLDMQYYREHEELPSYGFTPDADFPAIYGEKGIISLYVSHPIAGSGIKTAEGGNAVNMVADLAKIVTVNDETIQMSGVSAHGSTPEEGENAITKAMEAAAPKCSFAAKYMDLIGYHLHGEVLGLDFSDKQSGKLTMNVGLLKTDEEKITLGIDIRYPVTLKADEIKKRIKETFESQGFAAEITEHMDPVFMDENGEVIRTLIGAFREVTGIEDEPTVIGGGTYARAMPNIVAFGPIIPGHPCTEHMKNEHISEEDFEIAMKVYTLALKKLVIQQ